MEALQSRRLLADAANSGSLSTAGRASGSAPGAAPRDAGAPEDRLRIRLIRAPGPQRASTRVARRGWPRLSADKEDRATWRT
jgi:hypothetical protein